MSGFDQFLGNEKLIARLRRDIEASSLSHAYLIEGPEGCGKKRLALLLAAALSCEGNDRPCMTCPNCLKILHGQSPDVQMVEPEKDRVQLGVDVIRRVREDTAYTANDLDHKIYIVPEADAMNVQAQNALLKVLEEPPAGVLFLLLCEQSEHLLPTIRSRAPILRLEPLSDKQVSDYLIAQSGEAASLAENDPEAFRMAVRMAHGSIGKAIGLADPESASEALALFHKAENYLAKLADRRDAKSELAFYEYAVGLVTPKQRSELAGIYAFLSEAVRDLIAAKLTKEFDTVFYPTADEARRQAAAFPIKKLLKLEEIFRASQRKVNANVSLPLVMAETAVAVTGK